MTAVRQRGQAYGTGGADTADSADPLGAVGARGAAAEARGAQVWARRGEDVEQGKRRGRPGRKAVRGMVRGQAKRSFDRKMDR